MKKSRNSGYLNQKDYNFIYSKSVRLCVDLLILSKDGVYMTKRTTKPYKNLYHIPGGRIRFRETINDAIFRIANEEKLENIKIGKFVGVIEFLKETQDKQKRHSVSLVYIIKAKTPHQTFIKEIKKMNPPQFEFLKKHKFINEN